MNNLQIEGLHNLMRNIDQLSRDYTQDEEVEKGIINEKWRSRLRTEFEIENLSIPELHSVRTLIMLMLSERFNFYKDNKNKEEALNWSNTMKAFTDILIEEEVLRYRRDLVWTS